MPFGDVGQPVKEFVGPGPVHPFVNVLLGFNFGGSHHNDSSEVKLSEDCKLIMIGPCHPNVVQSI